MENAANLPIRKVLLGVATGLFALGLAVFSFVFAASMNPTVRAQNNSSVVLKFDEVQPGELKKILVEKFGRTLFVFRPTPEVLADLNTLDAHVWEPSRQAYNSERGIFVYWGESTKTGVGLEHIAKGAPRLKHPGHAWLGGYFDLMHDATYDYAGRTIKSFEYTYNGYNGKHPNMKVPKYEFLPDGNLLIRTP